MPENTIVELPLMDPDKAVASKEEWDRYTQVDLDRIVKVLREAAPATLTPQKIGLEIGRHNMTVQHRLAELVKQGRVEWVRYGQYRLAPEAVAEPPKPRRPKNYYRLPILKTLAESARPLHGQEIAERLGQPMTAMTSMLCRMAKDGQIRRVRKNLYAAIPDRLEEPEFAEVEGAEPVAEAEEGITICPGCLDEAILELARETEALAGKCRDLCEMMGLKP